MPKINPSVSNLNMTSKSGPTNKEIEDIFAAYVNPDASSWSFDDIEEMNKHKNNYNSGSKRSSKSK
jgi:hypothetical protein